MGTWSGKRRLSYFLIALTVILVIIGVVIIAYQPVQTCSDGKRNQDELGVDCGGACANVCSFEARPIKVFWTSILPVATGNYEAVAMVYNPNLGLRAEKFKWLLRVVDDTNILITTRTGEEFLNPGEKFAIFVPNIQTGERRPARAFLEIDGVPSWTRASSQKSPIELMRKDYEAGSKPILRATLTNTSFDDQKNVQIVALLLDELGNVYGASSTFVDSWTAGKEETVNFTWTKELPFERPPFSELYPHARYR